MMKEIVCILLLCCFLIEAQVIKFGLSITTPGNETNSQRAQLGARIRDGLELWKRKLSNKTALINGANYTFDYDMRQDYDNGTILLNNYQQLLSDPSVQFLLSPVNSDFSAMIKPMTEAQNRLLVATSAGADSFYLGGNWSFSVLTPSRKVFQSTVSEFRFKGVKTIAYIFEQHPYTSEACGTLPEIASDAGIEVVVGYGPLSYGVGTLTDDQIKNITTAIDNVQPYDADILVICAFAVTGFEIVQQLKDRNYAPRGIFVTPFLVEWESFEHSEYLNGHDQWVELAAFAADEWFGTSRDYGNAFREVFGYSPDGFNAFGTIAPLVLQESIIAAKSLNQADVKFALSRIDIDTFYGRVFYAVDNGCLHEMLSLQMINKTRLPTAPPKAQLTEMIYPMPTWDERIYSPKWYGTSQEIGILAITGLCIFISLILLIVVFYFGWVTKNEVIRAASPIFLVIVLIGSILIYSSIFLWTLNATDYTCQAVPWTLGPGFVIMYGSLFAKTWRIERIFHRKLKDQLRYGAISSTFLLLFVGGLTSVELIVLILWTAISPIKSVIISPDPIRPAFNYSTCQGDTADYIFFGVLAVYSVILIGWGCYLAYRIKDVNRVVFNESKLIAFSIYNMSIFGIITAVIQAANAADRKTLFVLRSLGIIACAGFSVGVLFVPKLYYIKKRYTIDTGAPRLSIIFSNKELKYLRTRVQQLERFLKENRIEAPRPTEEFDMDDYFVTSSSSIRE